MLFKNAHIFVDGAFRHGSFRVEDGKFAEILDTIPAEDGIDLAGQYVIPGLIDVHNHGNSNADFSDGDYEGVKAMAKYLASCGITSFAPTSMTLPYETLDAAFRVAAQFHKDAPEGHSRLMGIQMEGPFFSYAKKGAQNGAYLKDPDFEAFEKFVKDELGAELVYVSAATGENINELVRLAANKLEDLPPMQYYEADFVPEVVIDDGDRTVEIRNENGVYIVEGDWLYNFMGSINFDDRESLSYFQRILKSSGLIDQLEAAGVKDGDTVSMYEFEFDFVK
jgi:Obg family GTPase CgtA-like protein